MLVAVGLLGGCQTMQSPDSTKQDVAAATRAWADAVSRCAPDRIAALYDRDAVLWGTTSPVIISTPDGIRRYFDQVCASPAKLKVTVQEDHIRVHGESAINSGSYVLSLQRDGKTSTLPARFSFTYRKSGDQWLIADHHSSLMPAAQKP
jgi:uncharacterized protein (TIGR02246 family)